MVHSLIVCRRVERTPEGELSIHNVLDILPVDRIPGEAGPIEIVALLRHLPPGAAECAFVVSRDPGGEVVARYPLSVVIDPGFQDRQVAVQLRSKAFPVPRGGWFTVTFEWMGAPLAVNRFAVGLRGRGAGDAPRDGG